MRRRVHSALRRSQSLSAKASLLLFLALLKLWGSGNLLEIVFLLVRNVFGVLKGRSRLHDGKNLQPPEHVSRNRNNSAAAAFHRKT